MRNVAALTLVAVLFLGGCGGSGSADGPPPPPPPPPPPANSWVQRASYPGGPLASAVSFVIGDKLYAGTGFRNGYINSFQQYDPSHDTWTAIPPLPGQIRADAVAFAIGGYGYVGLGQNCLGSGNCLFTYFKDFWRYDPTNNVWTAAADFPGTGRSTASAFVIGQRAYIAGGSTAGDNDVWEFEPVTNKWTQKASFPGECISRTTAFAVGANGYVGLGNPACADFWRYDAASDTWAAIAPFAGSGRNEAAGISSTTAGFVAGGALDVTYFSDIWTYNPANNSWVKLNTTYPGKGRSEMIADIVGGRFFFGLGTVNATGGPTDRFDDFWEYIPE
jgi:N-acetylneuraminic acid mutarotase